MKKNEKLGLALTLTGLVLALAAMPFSVWLDSLYPGAASPFLIVAFSIGISIVAIADYSSDKSS